MDVEGLFVRPWLFRAWLCSLAPDTDVGATCFPRWSPITAWLRHETGDEYEIWRNDYNRFDDDTDDTGRHDPLLPLWAVLFSQYVDGRKDYYGETITAQRAIAALDQAERLAAQRLLPAAPVWDLGVREDKDWRFIEAQLRVKDICRIFGISRQEPGMS